MTRESHGANDTLEALERRIRTLLPEEYQDAYEDLQPVPMRSTGLKYGSDGKVAWNEIWTTFCDLAMAGGPPHKGMLLESTARTEADTQTDDDIRVVAEICRGIVMATDLPAQPSPNAGWVRVACSNPTMAGWLLRAVVMENVAARCQGATLDLPAASHFRLDKEIKNVVTVIAKTCHYWTGHMPRAQQQAIAELFTAMAKECPLVEPVFVGHATPMEHVDDASNRIAGALVREIGLRAASHRYAGWLGLECPSVRPAIWMMRALVASNVLSRREGTTLFVPVNPASDPGGEIVVRRLSQVYRFAAAKGVL